MYKTVFKACFHSTNKGKSLTSAASCFNLGKVYCNPELTKEDMAIL